METPPQADNDQTKMFKQQRSHTLPPTTPLSQQVGGHAGVQVTEDESLLLKPALPHETEFYQRVRDIKDDATGLHLLRDWIPAFFGLLSFEGKILDQTTTDVDGDDAFLANVDSVLASSSGPTQTLVLQNLLHGYRKPCVLDVKLGTVLYDEHASEEKKARMIRKAAETTTLKTGLRLTGSQVYSNDSPDPGIYGREYGYNLKPEQLQEGIRNFFPCSKADANSPPPNSNVGLPPDILLVLLTSIHGALADLRESISGAHVRMVGSSALIIYEGDWERAAAASGRGGGPNSLEEVESEEEEDDDDDQVEVEVDDEGGIIMEHYRGKVRDSESSTTSPRPRLYTVSLIDFAHTRVVPGKGPDLGVLLGMDTLMSLVDRRRQEVTALLEVAEIP